MNIYHITSRGAWIEATRTGRYTAASLESEGFIHCSTAAQVIPVAQQFYKGQTGLVLLVIDTQKLESPIRWEQSAPPQGIEKTATFPHVWGPIGLSAISACLDFETDGAGNFVLPMLPQDQKVEPSNDTTFGTSRP